MMGELETAIMEVLWSANEPMTVRAVFETLVRDRQLAYTTVMTVLDRLAKKGKVTRQQEARAWIYRSAATRSAMVTDAVQELLAEAGDEVNVVLAQLMEGLAVPQREHVERVLRALQQPA